MDGKFGILYFQVMGDRQKEGIKLTLQVLEKYLHNELSFLSEDGATDPFLS